MTNKILFTLLILIGFGQDVYAKLVENPWVILSEGLDDRLKKITEKSLSEKEVDSVLGESKNIENSKTLKTKRYNITGINYDLVVMFADGKTKFISFTPSSSYKMQLKNYTIQTLKQSLTNAPEELKLLEATKKKSASCTKSTNECAQFKVDFLQKYGFTLNFYSHEPYRLYSFVKKVGSAK